jgi:uncharacterized membrane protein (DUF2068 family)
VRNVHGHDPGLAAIALFKFVKATLLAAGALAAWKLTNPQVHFALHAWADALPAGFSEHLVQKGLAFISGVPISRWKQLEFLSMAYAGLLATEGIGLWRQFRWAEYLTILSTAWFLPFEVLELVRRPTPLRLAILAGNVLVVIYLVWHLRRRRNRMRG